MHFIQNSLKQISNICLSDIAKSIRVVPIGWTIRTIVGSSPCWPFVADASWARHFVISHAAVASFPVHCQDSDDKEKSTHTNYRGIKLGKNHPCQILLILLAISHTHLFMFIFSLPFFTHL
jgi:hypothetical protein